MFAQILIAILIGVTAGTFTGLTPGIHVNLVALILVSMSPFLASYFSLISIAVIILSCAITHTFIDSIPSIYLGAPDSDQALTVLPGHRLLRKGNE